EPVPPPPLAVAWIGQESLDEPLVRIGRLVFEEITRFVRARRHSDKIEINAPQQNLIGRFGRGGNPFRLESRENERVDRIAHPRAIGDPRRLVTYDLLHGPPRSGLFVRERRGFELLDPALDEGDLSSRERITLERHARLELPGYHFDKYA